MIALRILLLLSLITLLALPNNLHAEDDETGVVEWEPNVYPHGNLFPCLIIGTARGKLPEDFFASWPDSQLGDPQGLIGVALFGAEKGQKIKVTVHGSDYFEEAVFKTTLPEDADGILIHPKIPYNFKALAALDQPTPVNLSISVKLDGETVVGLETTMMGADDLPAIDRDFKTRLGDIEAVKNEQSLETFLAALEVGTNALVENAEAFDSADVNYQIINLDIARRAGILPISSTKPD